MNTYFPIPQNPAPLEKATNFDMEIIDYRQSLVERDLERQSVRKIFWWNLMNKLAGSR